jgi:hypothetical protein
MVRGSVTGTPQGGVVSALLCNLYLHRLDRAWQTRGVGVLVGYADDAVVVCRTRQQAERALAALMVVLAELGLASSRPRRGSCTWSRVARGWTSSGSTSLGARRSGTSSACQVPCPLAWDKAMQHARDRIRELTDRRWLLLPVEVIVQDVNRVRARVGRVFPVWELGPTLRQDQQPGGWAGRGSASRSRISLA